GVIPHLFSMYSPLTWLSFTIYGMAFAHIVSKHKQDRRYNIKLNIVSPGYGNPSLIDSLLHLIKFSFTVDCHFTPHPFPSNSHPRKIRQHQSGTITNPATKHTTRQP